MNWFKRFMEFGFKRFLEFGIVRTTVMDRCMIFFAGMFLSTIPFVLSREFNLVCIVLPVAMAIFVFSKKFKKVCNGREQTDGTSILFDVIPVNVKNDVICTLSKKTGMWVATYEVDNTPFFQKRLGLFWPDGTIVKRYNFCGTKLKKYAYLGTVAIDVRDGDSLDDVANELAMSLKDGVDLEDDEHIHRCKIPRFSSATELDMKLNLLGL